MDDNILIKKIPEVDFKDAIDVYTEAFSDDPLHISLFPELKERIRITKLFYKMMVNKFVEGLNLQFNGVYENDVLTAALIYARPDAYEWNEGMMNVVMKMRAKAKNDKVGIVSEYTMKANNFKPKEKHFYLNELAVGLDHRGKGFAKMLMADAENDAANFPEVKIAGLDTSNPVNVEIYKKLGYSVYKEFPFHGVRGYVMRKSLI